VAHLPQILYSVFNPNTVIALPLRGLNWMDC